MLLGNNWHLDDSTDYIGNIDWHNFSQRHQHLDLMFCQTDSNIVINDDLEAKKVVVEN